MKESTHKNDRKKEITIGKRNNIYQHIIVLKTNRYKRNQYKEIFVEGVRNINIAIKHGWKVKHWIYQTGKPLSDWAKKMLSSYHTLENYSFSEELISEISGKTDKSELMAIFEIKNTEIRQSPNPFIVLCNRPSKKGNLGSIIRSADSFNCDGIIVTGHAVDIYDPEVIVASMGSYFAVDIQKIETNEEILEYIANMRKKFPELQVIATTEEGEFFSHEIDYRKPTILLMGNEADGLSMFYWDVCDKTVKIPMVGEASSLNLACATSIFLYEAFTQRNYK